jgi:predicted nuclease of predicted toxin-antitoxin system
MARHLLDLDGVTKVKMKQLSGTARFYSDHNTHAAIVHILQYVKLDVVTAKDIKAEQQPDEFHYKYAFGSNRVLLTHDKDFLDHERFPLSQTCGVVVFNVDPSDAGQIARALEVVTVILAGVAPALKQKKFIVNSDYSMTMIDRVASGSGWGLQTTRIKFDTNGEDVWFWDDED